MTEQEKWIWSQPDTGIGTVKITSWQAFLDFVYSEMLDYDTYIWRGQRNSNWELESTLARLIRSAKVKRAKQYNFANNHLEQFKYATRGRHGQNPRSIESENDWWALGQHYGLATPLLDWTCSPFVAAYFSYIETGSPQTEFRTIYALHKPSVEEKINQIVSDKEAANRKEKEAVQSGEKKMGFLALALLDLPVKPEVEFIRPLSDENHRLVNQGGLFTKSPVGESLDKWIHTNFSEDKSNILIKILIPNAEREQALKNLNRMNINHLSLFPDLYGASKFCNLFGEIDNY